MNILIVALITLLAFAIYWLATHKPVPPENGNGNGDHTNDFSLRIVNPPEGTHFWFADKSGPYTLDQAHYAPAPFHGWIQFTFITKLYDCPVGDPHCEGKDCYLTAEAGKGYILDILTCNKDDDPDPPPPPPPPEGYEPEFREADWPATVNANQAFNIQSTWFLPDPWKLADPPKYMGYIYIDLRHKVGGHWYDRYTLSELDAYPLECKPLDEGDSIPEIWLNRESGIYTLSDSIDIPIPGTYTLHARVRGSKMVGNCMTTVPQQWYEFPNIGTIKVV